MKIVMLDGFAVMNNELDFTVLKGMGDFTVYDRTPPEKVVERIADAEVVYTNKVKLGDDIFARTPNLKFVGVLATGYDIIDVAAAKRRGITVANIPGYATMSVAQSVFALLLELTNKTAIHSDAVLAGKWTKSPDFCFILAPLTELEGKTFGIIGYGKTGQATAKIAQAFGMKVLVHSSHLANSVSMDELLENSDIVSLHCPLTDKNRNMCDAEFFAKMKRGAFFINTARGGLVLDSALVDALSSGQLAGAGLDVISVEPMQEGNPLLSAKNIVITPHIAWASLEARQRLIDVATENLASFLAGKPQNVVSK